MLRTDPPPTPDSTTLVRPRLVDALERRFDVKLTLVVGGGGVGKTTLLAQAFTDQQDRFDVWVRAVAADDRERLLGRVLLALGRPDVEVDVDNVSEAMVAVAPRQVCVMIDDAHLLPEPSVIGELVTALPRNGHVLVGSRRRPGIDLARLRAMGQVTELDQADLLFTDEELREVARRQRVDIAQLQGAAGWPAFVELAARGEGAQSRAFLEEEALARLAPERARDIARFAYVGGGDDTVARAVTGTPLEDLLHGLPLVIGDLRAEARPHDLWLELLDERLDDGDRRAAAESAARIHADRGDHDTAIALVARAGSDEHFLAHVRRACLSILDGGLRPDRLSRWVAQLPLGVEHTGVAHLLRGLRAREQDPYADVCWEELEAAADAFRADGDSEGEIAALAQLGYLTQWRGEEERLIELMGRMGELAAAGVAEAQPFLAFGEAWLHFAGGDPAAQLRAVETIDDGSVPAAWRLIRGYLEANALMGLGRPEDARAAVPDALRRGAAPLPGALTIGDQIEWACGRPHLALARGPIGAGPDHGSRDRFMAAIWALQMTTYAGRHQEAVEALEAAHAAAGPEPGPVIQVQLLALSGLPDLAAGVEDRATVALREVLASIPIETPLAKAFLLSHLPIAYLLLPETRGFWDETPVGPHYGVARAAAQALAAYRDEQDLGPVRLMRWPEPGVVAAILPVPWMIELSLIGGLAGAPAARRVAAWACEHWGAPAREALRRHSERDDDLAPIAAQWLVEVPMPPEQAVALSVVGPMQLSHDGVPTQHPAWRRERVRSLLLYLLLHGPAARDTVGDALWPELDPAKADKNLRTTLNYLHQVLEPMRSAREAPWFVRVDQSMLSLHPTLDVDLWRIDRLLDQARDLDDRGSSTAALEAYLEVLPSWRGDLAAGEADHAWADLERTRLRSRLIRAAARAGDLLVARGRADEAIGVCHLAIDADRWFEPAYAALARAYLDLGDLTSARRTVDSAATALAEIEVPPSAELTRLVGGSPGPH